MTARDLNARKQAGAAVIPPVLRPLKPATASPTKATAPTHPTLHRAAFHGVIGEIVDAVAPQTEADPVAILVQLLVAVGSMVGRNPYVWTGNDKHAANLFVVVVGNTAKGRKGTSWSVAHDVASSVDPAWAQACVVQGLSSGEGLAQNVRDPIDAPSTRQADHGVTDKRLLVVEAEFASPLRMLKREGNTLSPVLRNAWDGKPISTLTKQAPIKATGHHVSMIGHITEGELHRELSDNDVSNGLGNRILWVCSRRSPTLLPDATAVVVDEALRLRLRCAVDQSKVRDELKLSDEAAARWRTFYRDEESTDPPGTFGLLTTRITAQTRRLALIYALANNREEIEIGDLEAGIALARYCKESVRRLFGDDLGNGHADRILAALRDAGNDGMTRSAIMTSVLRNNVKGSELERALVLLADNGLVRSVDEPRKNGGRKGTRYFAVDG